MTETTSTEEQLHEAGIDETEPWEEWETKLCTYSIGIGIVGLVILGALINILILPGFQAG